MLKCGSAYLKKSEHRGGYSHVWLYLRRRKIDFRRWLIRRLHCFCLLFVHFWGLLSFGSRIDFVPFLLPFVQGSSSFKYSSPRDVFFMASRNELEKFDLLFSIEMRLQGSTSNQLPSVSNVNEFELYHSPELHCQTNRQNSTFGSQCSVHYLATPSLFLFP
jgi:hypothetical protein